MFERRRSIERAVSSSKDAEIPIRRLAVLCCAVVLLGAGQGFCIIRGRPRPRLRRVPSARSELELEKIPFKIVCESYRETDGRDNWELLMIKADGSEQVNLTNTPDLDEMYPHVSPDGTRICFVVDEGLGRRKVRSVYYMNIDGTDRVRVATNARQPCWSGNGRFIAYLKGEYERYSTREYATAELFFYDLKTRLRTRHPNTNLKHVYAICWSPDGRWFLGAVQGGMGYSDTIIAFEAHGTRVYDLEKWGVKGCRPDFNRDGTKIAWGETDWELCTADIDFSSGEPIVTNVEHILGCVRAAKVYHVDFSPDGKYLAFSYGPQRGGQQVGGKAEGWNICVADMTGKWARITSDGRHYKEPDWVPVP